MDYRWAWLSNSLEGRLHHSKSWILTPGTKPSKTTGLYPSQIKNVIRAVQTDEILRPALLSWRVRTQFACRVYDLQKYTLKRNGARYPSISPKSTHPWQVLGPFRSCAIDIYVFCTRSLNKRARENLGRTFSSFGWKALFGRLFTIK